MTGCQADPRDEGFTLLELLVVIIVIGVLSAIAIPTYLSQQQKSWRSQAASDLKNVATMLESIATDHAGSYSAADGATQDSALLVEEGFRNSVFVQLEIRASGSAYCVRGVHEQLERAFVYRSDVGLVLEGAEDLTCPASADL